MSTKVWRLKKPGEATANQEGERTFESISDLVAAMQNAPILPTWILLSPRATLTLPKIDPWQYKELRFDPDRLEIEIPAENRRCPLSFKEAQILKKLLAAPGHCVPRSELYHLLWGSLKVSSRTLDSHISRLRNKLEGSQIEILNVYGDGYLLR